MTTTSTTTGSKFVKIDINDPGYNAGRLLDTVMEKLGAEDDADLSRKLEVGPPVVSKIRNAKVALSAAMMIRIHDAADMSIATIRSFLIAPAK